MLKAVDIAKKPIKNLKGAMNKLWVVRWLRLWTEYRFVLKAKLKNQLAEDVVVHQAMTKVGERVLVPMIELSHYQFYQVLIFAKALELRGASVTVLLCGSRLDGCEIKSIKNAGDKDPCLNCRFNQSKIIKYFNLNFVFLSDLVDAASVAEMEVLADKLASNYPEKYLYKDIDVIPMVDESVVRYYYGGVPDDNPEELSKVRRSHLLSSMMGLMAAELLNKKYSPESVFSNMTGYSTWAPYFEYFQRKGAAISSINYSSWDYHTIRFSFIEHFQSNKRYEEFLQHRENKRLSNEEHRALYEVLNERFSGKLRVFSDGGWFESDSEVEKALLIDKSKRNVLLPANLFWDRGVLLKDDALFKGVIDWVLSTIAAVEDCPDVHLYIKPHPCELQFVGVGKRVEDFIHAAYPSLPGNVTIVNSEAKISPYEIMRHMDVGLLYSGTLGLEMLLEGVPVVVVGDAPYKGLQFAAEPESIEVYKKMIQGSIDIPKPAKEDVELFAFFYFIKSLIPWRLTKQAYADQFKGYAFDKLSDLLPGKDPYLDHLCNCVLEREKTVVEGWR